jgi:polysaccharide export outer membrane protein
MMRALFLLGLLGLSACQGIEGRAPTRDEFDPTGLPQRPPDETAPADNKAVEELLAQYAKRFSEGFPLYPNDEIRFSVLGNPDLGFEARVPTEGHINYPLIGKVQLVGRTVAEIQKEIAERLEKDFLVNPDVTILVKEYSKKKVYVLGAVAKPQDYELPSGRFATLLQTIAQAGGLLEDAAKHGVIIFRPRAIGSTERIAIPVNVVGLTRESKERDPIVLPDDIIVVPAREKAYVLGSVNRPGSFAVDADHGVSVAQGVSLAGGFTRIANDANVRLLRRGKDGTRQTYVINVARVVAGHPEEDAPLQPGDIVYVPESIF